MTIDDKIAELIAQAEPLRQLDDDDTAKTPLSGIVDQINALRARQTKGETETDGEVKPKRGRPAKVEGDDA